MDNPTLAERKLALRKYPHLVIFYLIPELELKARNWHTFPRDPYVAVTSSYWLKEYHSTKFSMDLLDIWSFILWTFLEFKGGVQNYSSNYPMLRLIYSLDIWLVILLELGLTTDTLAELSHKRGGELPFPPEHEAGHNFSLIAKRFWEHPILKAKKIFEIVKSTKAHEDYGFWNSHVKMDFERSFYHTQASVKTIPYDYVRNEAECIKDITDDYSEFDFDDNLQSFMKKLSGEHDAEIFRLLYLGYNQEQIAYQLGFANHSAVSKRLSVIRKEYLKYQKVFNLPMPSRETIEKYK